VTGVDKFGVMNRETTMRAVIERAPDEPAVSVTTPAACDHLIPGDARAVVPVTHIGERDRRRRVRGAPRPTVSGARGLTTGT
jgi:hypothetical protein